MSNGWLTIVTSSSLRVEPVLDERRKELVLVAAAPDAELLALHLRDVRDPAVLVGHLGHARLRVNTWAMLTRSPPLSRVASSDGQPVDPELRLARGDDLLRRDVGAAGLDRDVEAELLVVPLRRCRVVAGELRLRRPTSAAA